MSGGTLFTSRGDNIHSDNDPTIYIDSRPEAFEQKLTHEILAVAALAWFRNQVDSVVPSNLC